MQAVEKVDKEEGLDHHDVPDISDLVGRSRVDTRESWHVPAQTAAA